MTLYEQYITVATYFKSQWSNTPFFTLGEVIESQTNFIVFEAFGTGVETCFSGKTIENHAGYSIMCYGESRPKSLKIASDLQIKFTNKKVGDLVIMGGEIKSTLKLEDNLFETEVIFRTSSDSQLGE